LVSLLACKALQLSPAVRVEPSQLPGEVAEGCIAVLLHELVESSLRSELTVLLARVCRAVEVGLPLATASDETLLVQAPEDPHVGRVGARLLRAAIEDLHHVADRSLGVAAPDLLHHLCLEFVQLRRQLAIGAHYDAV